MNNIIDLQDFFTRYLKKYTPYKDQNFFNGFIDSLQTGYYENLYNQIPNLFKQMFEDSVIPEDIYSQILIAIGVSEHIVKKMSFSEKVVFQRFLSDFEKYKSTHKFVINLATAFSERISISELWITKNDDGNWVFRPVNLYAYDKSIIQTEDILYQEIYNGMPNFFISEEQLQEKYNNNELILPIKSNMLLINNNQAVKSSEIANLIGQIIISNLGYEEIDLNFSSKNISVELRTIMYTWIYLYTLYFNADWDKYPRTLLNLFNTDKIRYPLTSIKLLIEEYNNIDSAYDAELWYNKWIGDKFKTYYEKQTNINLESMYDHINSENKELASYISSFIGDLTPEDEEYRKTVKQLMDEIYYSLLVYANMSKNEIINKYFDYLLITLPQIIINPPEDSITYDILYNMKPYHTELVSTNLDSVVADGNLENISPYDDINEFVLKIIQASIYEQEEEMYFKITAVYQDSLPILSAKKIAVVINPIEYVSTICEFIESFLLFLRKISIISISTSKYMKVENEELSSSNVIYNAFRHKVPLKREEDFIIEEKSRNKTRSRISSICSISEEILNMCKTQKIKFEDPLISNYNDYFNDNSSLVKSENYKNNDSNSNIDFYITDEFELYINNIKV